VAYEVVVAKRPLRKKASDFSLSRVEVRWSMAMEDQTRPGMQLLKWTPQRKNALRGFADVRLRNGLVIYACPVLFSHGKAWATFPSKPQIGRDGLAIKIDGKQQYTKVMEWRDRTTAERFSERVVELVREHDPSAFAEDDTTSAASNEQ
jgi:hypothetical protein